MTRAWTYSIAGGVGVTLLALAGCGRGFFDQAQRAPWRHEAEVACLKSGAVKIGVEPMHPIEGPGRCGMDFPLKVSALGEASPALGYADELRPPAAIPNGSSADMPQWPPGAPRYASPPQISPVEAEPVQGEHLHWVTGPPGIDRSPENVPAGQPMSIDAPGTAPAMAPATVPSSTYQYRPPSRAYEQPKPARPSDIPPDAVIPPGGSAAVPSPRSQGAYNAPVYQPPQRTLPQLGPMRGPYTPTSIPAAELKPAAVLACPIVSALDRWVSEGVQPAALHWFGSPVTIVHQIGSYSCRDMVGVAGDHMSEHAFGNALDISGFTLADGRTITVKDGWHGTAEEQGFLHDVQLYACETFVTVLAPGYNIYHYNHIHVDLMRRASGRRPCRPDAIPGAVVAARVRAHYASRHHAPAYTGSIAAQTGKAPLAIPGADGYVPDDGGGDVTGSISPSQDRPGSDGEFDADDTGSAPWPSPPSSVMRAGRDLAQPNNH
jgi:hypothetical protein